MTGNKNLTSRIKINTIVERIKNLIFLSILNFSLKKLPRPELAISTDNNIPNAYKGFPKKRVSRWINEISNTINPIPISEK